MYNATGQSAAVLDVYENAAGLPANELTSYFWQFSFFLSSTFMIYLRDDEEKRSLCFPV